MHLSSIAPLCLVLLFCAPVVVETAVTGCLEDRDKDHRSRLNCTAAGFRRVPSGIEPSTRVLLFPQNHFSDLSWTTFAVFTELYEIGLSENQLPALSRSNAPNLPTLEVLRLDSNRLRAVPDLWFTGSPALTELYLQNNLINSLQDKSFSGLSKLEILDLSNNHIQTLPLLMMHPLTAIETLYLEGNKIKVLPDDWFSQKEEVPYLYLSANPWSCSCSLGYLHRYLEEYEGNVYVRDGPIISMDAESVMCGSPQSLKGQSVIKLEESDFCDGNTRSPDPADFADTSTTTITALSTLAGVTQSYYDVTSSKIYTAVSWYEMTRANEWLDLWGSLRGDGRIVKKTTIPSTTELPTTTFTTFPTSTQQTSTKLPTFPTSTQQTSTKLPTFPPSTQQTSTKLPTFPPSTQQTSTKLPTFPTSTEQISTIFTTFSTSNPIETQPTTIFTLEAVRITPTDAIDDVSNIISNGSSDKASSFETREVFCFWLFVSCVFLCVISAISSLITAFKLYFWYRGVYKSLKCIIVGKEQVRMVTYGRNVDKQQLRYRTMLFVSNDVTQVQQAESFVNLGPNDRTEEVKNVEKAVYKQEMYHVICKEAEIEAKDVLAECKASREANEGVSKKRYSVILREVNEKDGGETEKCDWVVGGWEVEKGAGPGSSWGEWLQQILPSMPWGVSAPPKSEAESQECRCVNEKGEE